MCIKPTNAKHVSQSCRRSAQKVSQHAKPYLCLTIKPRSSSSTRHFKIVSILCCPPLAQSIAIHPYTIPCPRPRPVRFCLPRNDSPSMLDSSLLTHGRSLDYNNQTNARSPKWWSFEEVDPNDPRPPLLGRLLLNHKVPSTYGAPLNFQS